jgi:hypothetical protein
MPAAFNEAQMTREKQTLASRGMLPKSILGQFYIGLIREGRSVFQPMNAPFLCLSSGDSAPSGGVNSECGDND